MTPRPSSLSVLAAFYFVYAAISALVGLLLIVQFGVVAVMIGSEGAGGSGEEAAIAGVFMLVAGGCALLLSTIGAVLNLLAGIGLLKGKWKGVTFTMAALNCLSIPFGTALGICTFVFASKPEAVAWYEQNRAA